MIITLYLEKQAFRQALNIPDEERIYVLLVNRKGEVLWRTEGPFEEEKGQDLQRMLESQQNSRAS